MAISSEEREILDDFLKENKDLLGAIASLIKDTDPEVYDALTKAMKDNTKYNFDGKAFKKGPLVLAMVQKYIADHPATTYADLQKAFPITLSFDKKALVRLKADVDKLTDPHKRVFDDDPITLIDGNVIYVNRGVQEVDMPQILKIAEVLGYVIAKV